MVTWSIFLNHVICCQHTTMHDKPSEEFALGYQFNHAICILTGFSPCNPPVYSFCSKSMYDVSGQFNIYFLGCCYQKISIIIFLRKFGGRIFLPPKIIIIIEKR
jgi:hypothetical protein